MNWVYTYNAEHPRPHHFVIVENSLVVFQEHTEVRGWILNKASPRTTTFFVKPGLTYEVDWSRPSFGKTNCWHLISHTSEDLPHDVRLNCDLDWLTTRIEIHSDELAILFKLRWSD